MLMDYVAGVSLLFNSIFKAAFDYCTSDPWILFLGLQFLDSPYRILKVKIVVL